MRPLPFYLNQNLNKIKRMCDTRLLNFTIELEEIQSWCGVTWGDEKELSFRETVDSVIAPVFKFVRNLPGFKNLAGLIPGFIESSSLSNSIIYRVRRFLCRLRHSQGV